MYIGRIGTGYSAAVAGKLLRTLDKLTGEVSPFSGQNAVLIECAITLLLVVRLEMVICVGGGA